MEILYKYYNIDIINIVYYYINSYFWRLLLVHPRVYTL